MLGGRRIQKTSSAKVPEAKGQDVFTSHNYQDIKFRTLAIVQEVLESKNRTVENVRDPGLRQEISQAVSVVVAGAGIALNANERERLLDDVAFEIAGFGPLEPLLADTSIDDIVINGHERLYVERHGRLERINVRFRDQAHLMNIIQRIVSPLGRRVDETSPYVDARLPDGSRVNVVVPPIAIDGPIVSIRKFKRIPLTIRDLLSNGALIEPMAEYLSWAVRSRFNVLVCGGTGSGKTTLLNILSSFIQPHERLVTIEDTAELQLRQPHVARLETRAETPDGTPGVSARDLVRNALRMRPDRIILGEVRGGEAVDMIQAMTTGHDGSMATLHANSPYDALHRLELLLGFGGLRGDVTTLRRQIASAINVVVQAQRMSGGQRRVVGISEVVGLEGSTITMNELFRFLPGGPHSGKGEFVRVARQSAFGDNLTASAGTAGEPAAAAAGEDMR
jgi:pilus assembly protein CpaF